jgi:hypothetical protein
VRRREEVEIEKKVEVRCTAKRSEVRDQDFFGVAPLRICGKHGSTTTSVQSKKVESKEKMVKS